MNKQKPEQTQKTLQKLLEQHWNHCRHLESERSWFMNAYAVVIGGVSAFLIGTGVTDLANNMTRVTDLAGLEGSSTFKFLVTFLIWFTFLGFFHTVRWTYAHECHRQRVKKLTGWMNLDYIPTIIWKDLDMDIPRMELPLPNLRKIWKSRQKLKKPQQACRKLWQRLKKFKEFREGFRTRYWFPALYFVVLILCAIIFSDFFRWWAVGWLVVALWLGIGFLRSKPK